MVLYSHSVLLSANRAGLRVSCALPPAQALAPTSAPLFAAFSAVLILLVVGHIVNQMTEMIQLFLKKKKTATRAHICTHVQKNSDVLLIQFTTQATNSCTRTMPGTASPDEGARTRGQSRQEAARLRLAFPLEKAPLYNWRRRAEGELFPEQRGRAERRQELSHSWQERWRIRTGREGSPAEAARQQ